MSGPDLPAETPDGKRAADGAGSDGAPQGWGAGARGVAGLGVEVWVGIAVVVLAVSAGAAWLASEFSGPDAEDPARLDAAVAALADRLTLLEERATHRPPPDPGPAAAARLRAIDDRLAALETRRADAPDPGAAESAAAAGLETLAGRVDGLTVRLGRVEAGAGAGPRAAARFVARADDMEDRLARLEAAAGGETGFSARLDRMEDRVARLAGAGVGGRGDALLLAVGQLRSAVDDGRPFARELAALRRIAGADGPLDGLAAAVAPMAAAGIPTKARLVDRFPALAAAAARAAIAPEDGSWLDRTVARIARVVTVRRVGENAGGDGALAVLARAEAMVAAGNLAGAAAALARLDGAPARPLEEWRGQARARAAAADALSRLSAAALERVGAPAEAPPR